MNKKAKDKKTKTKVRVEQPPLSGPIKLISESLRHLWKYRTTFIGLTLLYALLTLVLVRGLSSTIDVRELKEALEALVEGNFAGVTVTASLYGILLGTIGTVGTPSGSVYQSLLVIIISLATIWTLRNTVAGKNVRVRDAFYKGLYPLGVFVVVLAIIGLQLLPLVFGSWLYGVAVGGGIAIKAIEKAAFMLALVILAGISLHMITSSLFALFISTVPSMTPIRALKSARQIVKFRRLQILGRIMSLVIMLPLLSAIVLVPFIVFVPVIAEFVFFLVSTVGVTISLTYLYFLYRELLNE